MQMLKKRFPSLQSLGGDGNTSFLRAARAGNLERVLEHLKNNININTSNANGLNALHLASKDGHIHVVSELLRRGAIVDSATKKGNTALHIASLAGQEEVVKMLLDHGASVNVQSQNGFTPLYMAAQENHDSVVKLLLANGANQSLATEDGFTPLAVAMQQGHDKVVAVLLESDTRGKVRLPALHIAAKKDDVKAATLLLDNDHNPDVTSKSGFTPLHIASHYGNQAVANLLIQKGADVNYSAKHNINPLHVAAKWGKANMVSLLLEKGASIEAKTRDGLTPLHCAARSGHEQVVDMLLERGAPISAKTKNGLAPLHMAAQGEHVDAARILLYHRAPVDEVTVDYLTALHVAAHCGHVRVAKLLLDRNADANARALNGFTPLHIACKKNRIKVVELLLRHGASISATTESGLTPLHVAAFMGCMNIVIYLLQHDASPDVPTVRGETPLHLAARANQTDIIRILLRNGAQVDARAREQQTPLHIASRLGNVDIVMLLLQHSAQVDATTKDMYTALHIAAKEGQDEVAAVLIENGAALDAATKKGFTPLHLTAKYGHINVGQLLLQKEAGVDAQGKNGVTPLHVACHYNNQNVALLLLENGASPHATAKNGHSTLHIAARKNQMDIATTLLEYGAQANAESKAGFTPLHLACQEGHAEMCNLLIEHKASVNHPAKNGLTPIHLCAQEDNVHCAEILHRNGANIDMVTKAGYTPLHVAAHFGQANMVRFLLQKMANVDAATSIGYTPLHQTAQQGHCHIVNLLLEHKANANAQTANGQTPLHIARKLGYISVLDSLKSISNEEDAPSHVVSDEKYRVVAPEAMHESFMSDSEEEGGEDNMLSDQPYRYLTVDEMKSLGDDSLPIDVTRDERVDSNRMTQSAEYGIATRAQPNSLGDDMISPHKAQVHGANKDQFDSVYMGSSIRDELPFVGRKLSWKSFLVSFLVDARGGAMRGCRHSGVKMIIPSRSTCQPTRVTCRYVKPQRTMHPPQLMEGEALASRVLELGPVSTKFIGPVIMEVPHFASLRGKEREIIILRSDNGETWREHIIDNSEEVIQNVLQQCFEPEEITQLEEQGGNHVCRFVTYDFPQYFAVVSRIRQEVHAIGPEGGMVSSTVVPQVQAVFPQGALTKKIKVGLQAQPVDPDLTAKLLGRGVAVSPIVTVEPRRRKFHKAITLSMPAPKAHSQGMVNQYSGGNTPTLRLLCSITGGPSRAQWEDVTGSTPLTFVNDCVSFTTTVSARFWLMDCRNISEATKMATELYKEVIHVPFMAKFVVFAKKVEPFEARLRVFCMTDDREDKTLEKQELYAEVAKSRDVEVLEGKSQYVEMAGNLVPVTKSGEQLQLQFKAFRENRLPFTVRVKDQHADIVGRTLFMKEPKIAKGEPPQHPICILNIMLPENVIPDSTTAFSGKFSSTYTTSSQYSLSKHQNDHYIGDIRIVDLSNLLGNDWIQLAPEIGITPEEIVEIISQNTDSIARQAQSMIRIYKDKPNYDIHILEDALQKINREDIMHKCKSGRLSHVRDYDEADYMKTSESMEKMVRARQESKRIQQINEHEEVKYSAEEKEVGESESDEDISKRTVAERREKIVKRLSIERQIPASSQKKEITREITEIKRKSLIEDKKAIHESEIMMQLPIDNVVKSTVAPEQIMKIKLGKGSVDGTDISKSDFDKELTHRFSKTSPDNDYDDYLIEQKSSSDTDSEKIVKDISMAENNDKSNEGTTTVTTTVSIENTKQVVDNIIALEKESETKKQLSKTTVKDGKDEISDILTKTTKKVEQSSETAVKDDKIKISETTILDFKKTEGIDASKKVDKSPADAKLSSQMEKNFTIEKKTEQSKTEQTSIEEMHDFDHEHIKSVEIINIDTKEKTKSSGELSSEIRKTSTHVSAIPTAAPRKTMPTDKDAADSHSTLPTDRLSQSSLTKDLISETALFMENLKETSHKEKRSTEEFKKIEQKSKIPVAMHGSKTESVIETAEQLVRETTENVVACLAKTESIFKHESELTKASHKSLEKVEEITRSASDQTKELIQLLSEDNLNILHMPHETKKTEETSLEITQSKLSLKDKEKSERYSSIENTKSSEDEGIDLKSITPQKPDFEYVMQLPQSLEDAIFQSSTKIHEARFDPNQTIDIKDDEMEHTQTPPPTPIETAFEQSSEKETQRFESTNTEIAFKSNIPSGLPVNVHPFDESIVLDKSALGIPTKKQFQSQIKEEEEIITKEKHMLKEESGVLEIRHNLKDIESTYNKNNDDYDKSDDVTKTMKHKPDDVDDDNGNTNGNDDDADDHNENDENVGHLMENIVRQEAITLVDKVLAESVNIVHGRGTEEYFVDQPQHSTLAGEKHQQVNEPDVEAEQMQYNSESENYAITCDDIGGLDVVKSPTIESISGKSFDDNISFTDEHSQTLNTVTLVQQQLQQKQQHQPQEQLELLKVTPQSTAVLSKETVDDISKSSTTTTATITTATIPTTTTLQDLPAPKPRSATVTSPILLTGELNISTDVDSSSVATSSDISSEEISQNNLNTPVPKPRSQVTRIENTQREASEDMDNLSAQGFDITEEISRTDEISTQLSIKSTQLDYTNTATSTMTSTTTTSEVTVSDDLTRSIEPISEMLIDDKDSGKSDDADEKPTSFYIGESSQNIIIKTTPNTETSSGVFETISKEMDDTDLLTEESEGKIIRQGSETRNDILELEQEPFGFGSESLADTKSFDYQLEKSEWEISEKHITRTHPKVVHSPEQPRDLSTDTGNLVILPNEEMVTKTLQEVETSLDAAKTELMHIVKDGKSIKESPSEFQFCSMSEGQSTLQTFLKDESDTEDISSFIGISEAKLMNVDDNSRLDKSKEKDQFIKDSDVNNLVKFDEHSIAGGIVTDKSRKSTLETLDTNDFTSIETGADLSSLADVPQKTAEYTFNVLDKKTEDVLKSTKNESSTSDSIDQRWSIGQEIDKSSSSESQYKSFDKHDSRPFSSDVDNLLTQPNSSDYQTAIDATSTFRETTEYVSALSTLGSSSGQTLSSHDSMRSLDSQSETSANLGSISVSELSETLVASSTEAEAIDEAEEIDQESDLLDDDEDDDNDNDADKVVSAIDFSISDEQNQKSMMKRSQEMIFKVKPEEEEQDIKDKTEESTVVIEEYPKPKEIEKCWDLVNPIDEQSIDELKESEQGIDIIYGRSIDEIKLASSLDEGSILSVSMSSTSNIDTVVENFEDIIGSAGSSSLTGIEAFGILPEEATSSFHEEIFIVDTDIKLSPSHEFEQSLNDEQRKEEVATDDSSKHFAEGKQLGAAGDGKESESESDTDPYESEYARQFRSPEQRKPKKKKQAAAEIDHSLEMEKRPFTPSQLVAEVIIEDVDTEQLEEQAALQEVRKPSQNMQNYANIPDITVTTESQKPQMDGKEDDLLQEQSLYKVKTQEELHMAIDETTFQAPSRIAANEEKFQKLVQEQYKQKLAEIHSTPEMDDELKAPDSPDSFEVIEQPDITDEFVIVEEVAKEANEVDLGGQVIKIQPTKALPKHDEDVERMIIKSAPADPKLGSQIYRDDLNFEFEESPPTTGSGSDALEESDSGENAASNKRWVEMQLTDNPMRYPYDISGGVLEDIKEEDAEFEVGSSRISSFKDSFSSTPEYDVLATRRYYARGEHGDDISMSSLQEFESLEQAISLENRNRTHQGSTDSSNGSFPRRYAVRHTVSGTVQGDDISVSSLKEFEGLENACLEAHLIEIKAKEEAALLSRSDESNKSSGSGSDGNGASKTTVATKVVHQQKQHSATRQKLVDARTSDITDESNEKLLKHDQAGSFDAQKSHTTVTTSKDTTVTRTPEDMQGHSQIQTVTTTTTVTTTERTNTSDADKNKADHKSELK